MNSSIPRTDKDRVEESFQLAKELGKKTIVNNKQKFKQEEKLFLINLIAHCYSNTEIKFEMYSRFQKDIDIALIQQYKRTKKWVAVIKKLREQYCIDIDASPMASKRVRLDRLDRSYDRAVAQGDTGNQIKAVTQSQREKEGLHAHGDVNVYWNNPTYQQLNILSTEELLQRQKLATQKLLERSTHGPDRNTEENQK